MAAKQMKPYSFEEMKTRKGQLTSVDLVQWRQILLSIVNLNKDWAPLVKAKWQKSVSENYGYTGGDTEDKVAKLEGMLTYIASHSPATAFRHITERCGDLAAVWDIVRRWANVAEDATSHLVYDRLLRSCDPNGSQSYQDLYFVLKDAMEDSLVKASAQINNEIVTENEQLTPCIETIVVKDWIKTIGGPQLLEHIYRVYSADLKTQTLSDLQERISMNLTNLISEAENSASATVGRVMSGGFFQRGRQGNQGNYTASENAPRGFRGSRDASRRGRFVRRGGGQQRQVKSCQLCKSKGKPFRSHNLAECFAVTNEERNQFASVRVAFMEDEKKELEDYPLTDGEEEVDEDGDYVEDDSEHWE